MYAVPIRDGKGALIVDWLEIEIIVSETRFQHDAAGKTTYHNSFVTYWP